MSRDLAASLLDPRNPYLAWISKGMGFTLGLILIACGNVWYGIILAVIIIAVVLILLYMRNPNKTERVEDEEQQQ